MSRMLRILFLLVMIILICMYCSAFAEQSLRVGDVIMFGAYEQDNDLYNGNEPIEWLVLESNSQNQAMLISLKVLDAKPYDTESVPKNFAFGSLYQWLNNDFYNSAFTPVAQEAIFNDCSSFSLYDENGELIPTYVILLDHLDFDWYFPNKSDRLAYPTDYALAQGLRSDGTSADSCSYWIRSIASNTGLPGYVSYYDGSFGSAASTKLLGVRPVIYIDSTILPALEDSMPEAAIPTLEPTPEPTLEPIVISSEDGVIPADEKRKNISKDDPLHPLLGQYLGIDESETYTRLYFYADGNLVIATHQPGKEKSYYNTTYMLYDNKIYLNGSSPEYLDSHRYEVYHSAENQIYLLDAWSWTRLNKTSDDVSAIVEHVVEIPANHIQGVPDMPDASHLDPNSTEAMLLGRYSGYYYDDFNSYVFHADGRAYVLTDRMNDIYVVCTYAVSDDIVTILYPSGRTDKLQFVLSDYGDYLTYPNDYCSFSRE